jgi:hypothetical protein
MKIFHSIQNTIIIIAITLLAINAHAKTEIAKTPQGLQRIETNHLDDAWKTPDFDIKDYNQISIKVTDFEYRPAKKGMVRYHTDNNYELSDNAKKG